MWYVAQLFPRFQRDNVSFRSLRFSVHPSFGGRRLFVGERTNGGLTDEQQALTLTLRCHSSSFFSSSSSCSRNWWQMASTRLANWPLLLSVLGRKIVNLPPEDPQFRPGCRYANSLRWVPRKGKSIIKWGHRRVLVAIWGGFLDDCCHTSDVGSQIVVFLTVSYFIVILLFRRIWQSFHLTFCDSNSCDSWFLEGYVFSLFLYILLIIN